jgi:oligoribonuclease NrnB/cAMP/cGMP phosphodiesterase (DHH superfamily)
MDPLKVDIIFYHNPCQDGLSSAWVAFKYSKENNLNYEFIGMANNNPIDFSIDIKDKNVMFLDIAPSEQQLELLNKDAKGYFILDHHKTNEERLRDNKNVIFKMDKSGVGITWEFFYPEEEMPLFLQMVQDRDIWTWTIPNSKSFCEGLYTSVFITDSLKESFELYDEIYKDPLKLKEIISLGEIIEKKKEKQINGIAKSASNKTYNYKDYKVCIVNCDHELASDLGNLILRKYNYDFVVCWRYNHNTEEYWLSMRADNKVDVSEICKEFAGGGHKNAAGCSTKIHPSILFKTKTKVNLSNIK